MIRFVDASKTFGEGPTRVCVLKDFSLEVPAGQFCAIMGPSGAGKSTVLHLIAGLTRLSGGEMFLSGRPLSNIEEREAARMRRREIGFIFQFFHLISYLSSEENVALPLLLDGHSIGEIRRRTDEVLAMVGIEERRHHKPSVLSGGELQRVAIARALVAQPRVILADEPTGNLDSNASQTIMRLLGRVNEELGVTILMVTHDPVYAAYADRVVRLVDGEITEDIDMADSQGSASLEDLAALKHRLN